MQKSFAALTDEEIIELIDRIFSNLAGLFPRTKTDIPGWGLHRGKDFSWVKTAPPSEYPNLIFDIKLSDENIDEGLERIVAGIHTGELPVVVAIGPHSRPSNLKQCLLQHGFQSLTVFPGMAFDVQSFDEETAQLAPLRLPSPDSELIVEEVTTDNAFQKWVEVNNTGFREHFHSTGCELSVYNSLRGRQSEPYVKFYGAYLDGKMVGAAQANYYPTGFICKLIELHQCSVLPAYRQMGIARRLVSRPLQDARNEAYAISTLFAAPKAADPFWTSIGYRHYCYLEWLILNI